MNRSIHLADSIFGNQDDLDGLCLKEINQIAGNDINRMQVWDDGGVNLVAADVRRRMFSSVSASPEIPPPHVGGYGRGPQSLQVVIQMRQINQAQRRMVFI